MLPGGEPVLPEAGSEKYSNIADSLPKFIQDLMERPEKETVAKILDELVPYCLDRGTSQRRFLKIDEGNTHIYEVAEPINILTRAAFINHIEELPEEIRNDISVNFLDIKDLRASDRVISETGDKGADLLINNVASKISEKVALINQSLALASNFPGKVVAGRYGGDEFVLLFEGIGGLKLKEDVLSSITNPQDGVTSLEGFFLRDGAIHKEKVQLKSGMPEITIPTKTARRNIFWEYVHRGILLNDKEIDVTLTVQNAIPKNTTSSDSTQRRENLLKKHSEFDRAFQLIDAMEGNTNNGSFKTSVELGRFIYNIAYDRLLGEYVSNMVSFSNTFLEKPYDNIYVVDVKGIKEINDTLGMASGDQAILAGWGQIRDILEGKSIETGKDEMAKVGIYKRGALFLICEYNKDALSSEKRKLLGKISGTNIKVNGVESSFSVATYTAEDLGGKSYKDSREVSEMLDGVLAKAEQKWYREMIVNNISSPNIFSQKYTPDNKQIGDEQIDISAPEVFVNMFLYGKRREERTAKALEAIDTLLAEAWSPEKYGLTDEQFDVCLEIIRNIIINGAKNHEQNQES